MFSFLNEGKDISGYLGAIDIFLPYAIKMAVIPAWMRHFQVLLVPFSRKFRDALKCFNALTADSIRYVDGRVASKATRTDMLEKLLKISREKVADFDITDVYTESYTAMSVPAIFIIVDFIEGAMLTILIALREVIQPLL